MGFEVWCDEGSSMRVPFQVENLKILELRVFKAYLSANSIEFDHQWYPTRG